jgi:radical SAM/Cys-rich protein
LRLNSQCLRIDAMENGIGFGDRIRELQPAALAAIDISILQVNLGYRCNMACAHCHVDAGPDRDRMMGEETIKTVIEVLKDSDIKTLDITGGAPEMNPHFACLVTKAREAGRRVVVRTNLTIFFEEGMERLPEFMSDNSVRVIASLPCYTENNVDRTRGKGTFKKCVKALTMLNGLGYGNGSADKILDLVYNPSGPFLAPPQKSLEEDYKRELKRNFGIAFDSLYAFTNMPIGRFRDSLLRTGGLEKYMKDLISAFNPENLQGIMCRKLLSIGWDGRLYDCDFNQMLGVRVHPHFPQHIKEFDYSRLINRPIAVGDHCYACTAGQGST